MGHYAHATMVSWTPQRSHLVNNNFSRSIQTTAEYCYRTGQWGNERRGDGAHGIASIDDEQRRINDNDPSSISTQFWRERTLLSQLYLLFNSQNLGMENNSNDIPRPAAMLSCKSLGRIYAPIRVAHYRRHSREQPCAGLTSRGTVPETTSISWLL